MYGRHPGGRNVVESIHWGPRLFRGPEHHKKNLLETEFLPIPARISVWWMALPPGVGFFAMCSRCVSEASLLHYTDRAGAKEAGVGIGAHSEIRDEERFGNGVEEG